MKRIRIDNSIRFLSFYSLKKLKKHINSQEAHQEHNKNILVMSQRSKRNINRSNGEPKKKNPSRDYDKIFQKQEEDGVPYEYEHDDYEYEESYEYNEKASEKPKKKKYVEKKVKDEKIEKEKSLKK